MIQTNIKQFLAAARQHLLGLIPAPQVFATIPVAARKVR